MVAGPDVNTDARERKETLLKLLCKYGVSPCTKMTELGCGTGVMTRLLSDEGFTQ
ncbi:MAG: hypothetical protein K6G76_05925 [Lachnospiraceae bacterium]|nr:hypothetical protein [Lachnospiraceae bacterium]